MGLKGYVDSTHVLNDKGAKVYLDPMNHEMLDIPEVDSLLSNGKVYHVLSVGFHFRSNTPCVTIKEDDDAVLYFLPVDLSHWVRHCLLSADKGVEFYPADVVFGTLTDTYRTYAEII